MSQLIDSMFINFFIYIKFKKIRKRFIIDVYYNSVIKMLAQIIILFNKLYDDI